MSNQYRKKHKIFNLTTINENKETDSDLSEYFEMNKRRKIVDDSERSIDIADYLKASESAIRKHGINKVTSLLNNMDIQSEIQLLNKQSLVDFICDCIVNEFKSDQVTKKDLFCKNKRGEVTLARKMTIVLIKQFLSELTDTQIGKFFGRTRQVIFYTMEEFKDMNPKNKQHAYFLTKHSSISKKIELFIEQNNQ